MSLANIKSGFDFRKLKLPSADTFPHNLLEADRLLLLVTGVAGVSGLNAFAFFRQRYGRHVTGQRPLNNWPLSGTGIIAHDLEDAAATKELIKHGGFRTVLNCGGSCALKSCELDVEMAERVNVRTIGNLVDAIAETDIRFVHLSIDLVFSGTAGGRHLESDPPDPVTVYGRTMLDAEKIIAERLPNATIARISLPMGVSFNGHAGAIDWIQARFSKNKPATLYYDEVRTPTYVDCLNEVCEDLLAGDYPGLFHLGGTRHLSLNQIAQIVNRVGGYNPENLKGCFRIEAGPIPPRAGNVTMDSSRLATALKRQPFVPWPYFDELIPTDRNWHFRRDGFVGSPKLIKNLLYRRPLPGKTLADFLDG